MALLCRDSWFGALTSARQEALVAKARVVRARSGRRVYRLGDAPDGLHAVLDGRVRLVSYPAPGAEMVSMVVKPGRWFGELSVLDGQSRPHDAIASCASRLLHVPMNAVTALAEADPLLWRDLARLACLHQRMAMKETTRTRALAGVTRLAALLLADASRDEQGIVRTTQEDMAQLLGLSRQYVNRLLSRLTAKELISVGYGTVAVRDRPRLRALVDSLGHE